MGQVQHSTSTSTDLVSTSTSTDAIQYKFKYRYTNLKKILNSETITKNKRNQLCNKNA